MRRVRYVSAATPPASSIPALKTPTSVVKAARPGWARIADCTSTTNGDVTCGFMPAAANARADAPSARRDARLPTTSAMKSGSFTPAIRASLYGASMYRERAMARELLTVDQIMAILTDTGIVEALTR